MFSENRIVVSRMVIHGRRESRTMVAKSWQRGVNETFSEYLAPPREQGTKMLKLGGQLWIYSPSTDRIIYDFRAHATSIRYGFGSFL